MVEKLVPGKLYKTKRFLMAMPFKDFEDRTDTRLLHYNHGKPKIEPGEIFLFVEEIERALSTYSKILHRDQIYVINNAYYIRDDIEEINNTIKEQSHGRV